MTFVYDIVYDNENDAKYKQQMINVRVMSSTLFISSQGTPRSEEPQSRLTNSTTQTN